MKIQQYASVMISRLEYVITQIKLQSLGTLHKKPDDPLQGRKAPWDSQVCGTVP